MVNCSLFLATEERLQKKIFMMWYRGKRVRVLKYRIKDGWRDRRSEAGMVEAWWKIQDVYLITVVENNSNTKYTIDLYVQIIA